MTPKMHRLLPSPPLWMTEAACIGLPSDLFHPSPGDHVSARQAKGVCRRCPIREACLDYALAEGERFGIWGGMGPSERWKEAKRRRFEVR